MHKKSFIGLRDRIRALTKRHRGDSIESIISLINPILRGWFSYFRHAHRCTFSSIDGFVRRRLRAIQRHFIVRVGVDAFAITLDGQMPSSLILGCSRCPSVDLN